MPDAGDPETAAAPEPGRRTVGFWHRQRVQVRDESMLPTLRPGDRLLVDRAAYRDRAPRPGEIVVLVDPEVPSRWLVKRVGPPGPTPGIVVLSDAPGATRDSRRFGPVPRDRIVGRVYRRYYPPDRREDL